MGDLRAAQFGFPLLNSIQQVPSLPGFSRLAESEVALQALQISGNALEYLPQDWLQTDLRHGHGGTPMVPFWVRCTTHVRTYVSGDWDVHWGYGVLTHSHMSEWVSFVGARFWVVLKGQSREARLFWMAHLETKLTSNSPQTTRVLWLNVAGRRATHLENPLTDMT